MKRFLVGGALAVLAACDASSKSGDLRVVTVTVRKPDSQAQALGGTKPVQLVAVQIEGGQVVRVTTGAPADSSADATLSAGVSKDHAVVLFLQVPRGNTATLGQLVARILWSDGQGGVTGTLRAGQPDVNLGPVTIAVGSASTLADNVALVPDDHDPLRLADRDGDGANDLVDTDDDGDGIADGMDPDADGDGLADMDQELASLPDRDGREDGDGVPDDVE